MGSFLFPTRITPEFHGRQFNEQCDFRLISRRFRFACVDECAVSSRTLMKRRATRGWKSYKRLYLLHLARNLLDSEEDFLSFVNSSEYIKSIRWLGKLTIMRASMRACVYVCVSSHVWISHSVKLQLICRKFVYDVNNTSSNFNI